jgi:hypothetical protein
MAKLTLRIDANNIGEETIADNKFIAQVDLAVAAWAGPVTGITSEKLLFVATKLRRYLLDVARGQKRQQRQDELEAALIGDNSALE